jgi:hypothetical protein
MREDLKIIENLHVDVPKDTILKRLGKRLNTKITSGVDRKIDEIIKEGKSLIHPKCIYRVCDFKKVQGAKSKEIHISDSLIIESKNLYDLFKHSKKALVIACTIGEELSKKADILMKTNISDAVILDAYGSEAVEELIECVNKTLKMQLHLTGYKLTRRYSPGYGDLPLSDQPYILQFLESDRIGLTTDNTLIMKPEKSITAFIGLER